MIIFINGCGALGSQLAYALARPGLSFVLLDDDGVEENNIYTATTVYTRQHLGSFKAVALGEILARKGAEVKSLVMRLDHVEGMRLFTKYKPGTCVLVDAFDNEMARRDVTETGLICGLPILHVGVSQFQSGIVTWDRGYPIETNPRPRGENVVCTNQLGRAILTLTSMVGANTLETFLQTGKKEEYWTRVFNRKLEIHPG